MAADTAGVLERAATLIDPLGGLISEVHELPRFSGYPRLFCFATDTEGLPALRDAPGGDTLRLLPKLSGAGVSVDPREAELRAVGETIERYCMSRYAPEQFIHASARELGGAALDLDRIARCAPWEPAVRSGQFALPDKDARVRWVKGVSLMDGRRVLIPAIMVYLYFPPETPAENFWIPISTGCAFHEDLTQALLGGLCEVIERDALALTWLHQLPLAEFELGDPARWPARFREQMSLMRRSGLELRFFDATSDLGVPTVYTLQMCDHTRLLANLVISATRVRAWQALTRTVEEGCSSRLALDSRLATGGLDPRYRERPELLHELEDCALFYAERERRADFAFLLEGSERRPVEALPDLASGSPAGELVRVLERLRRRGYEAYAVDLTTPEVRAAGFWVVRVLVPQLVPMSPAHAIRFLDSPRLYEAPPAMGFGARTPADITSKPQPFA